MLRALVAALSAAGACVLAASAAGGPLRTAVAEDVEFNTLDPDLALTHVHDAGATAVRATLSWYSVAPVTRPASFDPENPGDPAYRWQAADAKVTRAVVHGLEPFLVVNDAPVWARTGDKTATAAPDAAELAAFMHAAAERYSGRYLGLPRVRYWQVWIEPNVNKFFAPLFEGGKPVAPVRYAALVDAAASAVHAVDPTNRVIAGGLSPFTVKLGGTQTIGPLRFMRTMLCMSKGAHPKPTCDRRVHFDIWSHHPYTTGGPTHHAFNPDDVSLGDLPEMKRLLDAAYKAGHIVSAGRPGFWVTEFSWDTNPPDPHAVPVKLQARWTAEALYRMWKAGVSLVTWLKLRDDPYPEFPVQSGLYYRGSSLETDRPKPTFTAFKFPFVAYSQKGGVFVWGRTPWGKRGRVEVDQKITGTWRRLAVFGTDGYGIFSRRLRTRMKGFLRAQLVTGGAGGGTKSLPFSLHRPRDRMYPPFG
jgi:hypothetical protein